MNEYTQLLQKTIISEMAKEINKRKKANGDPQTIDFTAEEVFANLPDIYETANEIAFGSPTGRSYRYMPKRFKAMVMRLVAPEYYPLVKVNTNEDGVCAEAWLYLNHEDSKPVAYGKQYLSYESAKNDNSSVSDSDLHAYVESTVRGIALSKAYQDFGIGSWYSYRFDVDEHPDEVLSSLTNADGMNPTKAYDDGTNEGNVSSKNDGSNVQSEEKLVETTVESPALPPEKEKPTQKERKTKQKKNTSISLESARAMMAPIGKAASMNLTLGQTEEKYPGNILWMYLQKENGSLSPEQIDAILLIVSNNPDLQELFKQRGIDI